MTPRWGLEFPGVGVFPQRCRLYEAPFASSGAGRHFTRFRDNAQPMPAAHCHPAMPFRPKGIRRLTRQALAVEKQTLLALFTWRASRNVFALVLNSSAQAAFSSRLPFVQEWVPICG